MIQNRIHTQTIIYIISYCVYTIHIQSCKYCKKNFNIIEETMGFEIHVTGKNQSAADFPIGYINYVHTDKIFLESCPNYIKKTWSGNQVI